VGLLAPLSPLLGRNSSFNANESLATTKPCCKFISANNKNLLLHNEWVNPTQTILPSF